MLCGQSCAALNDGNLSHVDFFFVYSFFGTPKVINELVPSAFQEGKCLEETTTSHPPAPSEEAGGGHAAWRGS